MKRTLLELTQSIMNEMDGDEVQSIADTIESQQVAAIIRDAYFEVMANRNWPGMRKAFTLSGSGDSSKPTELTLPEEIKELHWLKYNKRRAADTKDKYQEIEYLQPEAFYAHCAGRNSSASNVQIVMVGDIRMNIRNDTPPQYWTSYDDNILVLDAYDSDVDSTLQQGKTAAWGTRNPTWTHEDSAIPELPAEAFPMLLEEAKSTAFYVLRQTANEKAEQKSARQQRWLSRKAWRTKGGVRYPDYGRKRNTAARQRSPYFDKDAT